MNYMLLKINNHKYKIYIANTFTKRFYGLMGKTNINYGLILPKCNSIHTFFMKEAIDIIGLNEFNQVIYKYENLPKNRIIKINNPINQTSILEMPHNSTKEININDTLTFYSLNSNI